MQELSWGKISVIIIGFLVTNFLSNITIDAYNRGTIEMQLVQNGKDHKRIELELKTKPNNDVIMEYMHLQDLRHKNTEGKLVDLKLRVRELERRYIHEPFRGGKKDDITYSELVNFTWEQNDSGFIGEFLKPIENN